MARGSIVNRTLTNGEKRYDTVIRIAGRQRWKTFPKKRQAEAFLDLHSTDIREGTYRELKKATLNAYGSALALHLVPAFGPRPLTAIDADHITGFESQLLSSGQSGKSTRNILGLLSRILGDARQDGYLRQSPMTDLKFQRVEKEEASSRSTTLDCK